MYAWPSIIKSFFAIIATLFIAGCAVNSNCQTTDFTDLHRFCLTAENADGAEIKDRLDAD
jgi:hypothetical protein